MKTITVLLSEDHTLVRQGLRLLLETASDIQVIGEAVDGHQSVRETKRLKPDVVIQDIGMPLLNGVEATRQISKAVPSAKVLILSAYSDDQQIDHAIEAGAAGYLTKETISDDLLEAIREVARGNTFFSPLVARRRGVSKQRMDGSVLCGAVRTKANKLTSRQTEVLQLIAEGYATKQIAGLLLLSIKTVEKHRQDLMNTLNIHCIATLTRYAVSNGVVEPNCTPICSENPSRTAVFELEHPLSKEMATA